MPRGDWLNSIYVKACRRTSAVSAAFSNAALRLWLFLLRQDVKFTRLNISRLRRRNLLSEAPVIAPGGPVVSLTTYGTRVQSVYLTLESIGAGSLLPARLILWIDDPDAYHNLPSSIRRLEARGLEVLQTNNYGPHKKYFPYLLSTETFTLPLVTADDDTLYPKCWLAKLYSAYRENPDVVNCHRAHSIFMIDGMPAPYVRWVACRSTEPSFLHFATGSSGCIYPPGFLAKLKIAGQGFLNVCPKGDDIWLHANAVRAGLRIRQIGRRQLNFPFLPDTQSGSLSNHNVRYGGNDRQIARTYTECDIAILRTASTANNRTERLPHLHTRHAPPVDLELEQISTTPGRPYRRKPQIRLI
jgi:hypothetical protein